jgi:toxin ParE1/3/4
MATVYRHAAARRDLIEQFVYLAEEAGLNTAERFLVCAEASFNNLAHQPMIGAPLMCAIRTLPPCASGASTILRAT